MRYLFLLVVGTAACGGSRAPETAVNPSRALRSLTPDDPEISAIAVSAAQALPPKGTSTTYFFSGVYVNGRKARLASDAVARATGFTQTSSTRTPTPQCRAQNMSTGQSTPIPCPASAKQMMPPTLTFDEVRATADSAYVGVTEASEMSSKASCVTLVRRQATWSFLSTAVIADGKHCGR